MEKVSLLLRPRVGQDKLTHSVNQRLSVLLLRLNSVVFALALAFALSNKGSSPCNLRTYSCLSFASLANSAVNELLLQLLLVLVFNDEITNLPTYPISS